MKKKYIFLVIVFLIAATIYALLFHKDKALKFIPNNADVVVLVDVKKVTRQYIFALITHPSEWFKSGEKNKERISIHKSGMKIPDFIQIFHLKNTQFGDWYSILELEDKTKFVQFLKQNKFIKNGEKLFHKDGIFINVEDKTCIVGTSNAAFENIRNTFLSKQETNILNADQFIKNSAGSISYISESKITNFLININSDDIEVKSSEARDNFKSLISKLDRENQFLNAELDEKNVKSGLQFFNKDLKDSLHISYFKTNAELEEVNDTIISYGYDDNFNEIEKVSYQKIIQPNFIISLQNSDPEQTWKFFQNKKWINSQNQFTAIPIQPNRIVKKEKEIIVQTTRNPLQLSQKQKENYIFIKNSKLLSSSFLQLKSNRKKLLSNIYYIFYGNKSQDYLFKIKLTKNKLPLLLRW
ncbi:hypothetical protein NZ698_10595 [Chryseobacterium sp. PBS4-4]|uniref:DUF4340 domain-containing protein n=1 Tax=Chryseobacterium edaphi TaxID=2976532 RepID=A0ABT2W610_9FLAO|nr:hypothetical protein [Chryseobacterium edaphi]MCU7617646.1 hypothetical protein [Chryseobacterium edaphi]